MGIARIFKSVVREPFGIRLEPLFLRENRHAYRLLNGRTIVHSKQFPLMVSEVRLKAKLHHIIKVMPLKLGAGLAPLHIRSIAKFKSDRERW